MNRLLPIGEKVHRAPAPAVQHRRDGVDQQYGEAHTLFKAADMAQGHDQDAGQHAVDDAGKASNAEK